MICLMKTGFRTISVGLPRKDLSTKKRFRNRIDPTVGKLSSCWPHYLVVHSWVAKHLYKAICKGSVNPCLSTEPCALLKKALHSAFHLFLFTESNISMPPWLYRSLRISRALKFAPDLIGYSVVQLEAWYMNAATFLASSFDKVSIGPHRLLYTCCIVFCFVGSLREIFWV